ncbi:hypothetical protein, conserved [Plasmodium gonderi]|uniref:Uncharacterized protein n=1 Tax=Plasmodium gonderi TaxID=77519 RepID=A0A1Y1JVA3_PLAGO|nr:hypothetical protein, conserved [Plasmodium gonderi]GAW83834.1 hypothetical protein, conserved [Plasmodium gonderi]
MSDEPFYPIKNLKPLLNNLSIQCLIIKYLEDPPQHINNIIKYHYLVADITGSVILCIPHTLIEEELKKKNINILNDDIEDVVDSYNSTHFNMNEGANYNVTNQTNNYTHDLNKKIQISKDSKNITHLTNISSPKSNKISKYFFRVGDILNIDGAVTTWSMGKMVIMPNTRGKKGNLYETRGSIQRVGFFSMKVSLEPNVSNLITSTTEKKYQEGDEKGILPNRSNVAGKSTQTLKNKNQNRFVSTGMVSKYDILPLISSDDNL